MSIRKQDIAVLLFDRLGYSKVRNFILRLRRAAVSRVVTFHDLPPESLGDFEEKLWFLKRNTNVVSLDDHFHGRLSTDKINVVITFDDGYMSWATGAAPILSRLELPATFFVSSGFVGISGAEQAAFMRSNLVLHDPAHATGGLDHVHLRQLADRGFTIGGHALNHRNLGDVRDIEELRREIAEDKRRLEAMTGSRLDYFAYPFGVYKNPHLDIAGVLRESGYRGAVTTVSGFNTTDTNPYLLHRELTPASMAKAVFRARAFGNYDAVQLVKRRIGRTRERAEADLGHDRSR